MFPLEYPLRIVKKHKRENPTIIDPFCGRGTTIYAARRAGLRSYGFDISPIAVAIAKAKLSRSSLKEILALADRLLGKEPGEIPDTPFFRGAYSQRTLKELCSVREGLLRLRKETNQSALLRATALGCLHGPRSMDLSQAGYFSNQMPRTFASKPDYSVRYWKRHELKAPEVSVRRVIKRKLEGIRDLESPTLGTFRRIQCADARKVSPYKNVKGNVVVVTSPPYYGMNTYVQDQWLRNWFLGGPAEVDYEMDAQLNHSSHEDFASDLGCVWTNLKKKAEGIDLYVRLGTIPSCKSDAQALFRSSLEESGGWRLISTRRAKTASEGKRQADQMRGQSFAEDEFDFHAIAT